jgi:transposase-like protein
VRPILIGRQHLDEKYIKVKGKDNFDLNCIDSVTKYTTAHLFVDKRTKQKCYEFLKQIKDSCYEQILKKFNQEKHKKIEDRNLFLFVFDGFENYKSSWSKLFGRVTNAISGVPIACKKHGLKHNNNPIERYNGSIKDRLNGMRSQFKSFKGAEAFMNLKDIVYNFVSPHQQLQDMTPAENAGINLKLGRNKLLNLIKRTAKSRHHSLR